MALLEYHKLEEDDDEDKLSLESVQTKVREMVQLINLFALSFVYLRARYINGC